MDYNRPPTYKADCLVSENAGMVQIIVFLKVFAFLAHFPGTSPRTPSSPAIASSTRAAVFPNIAHTPRPKHLPPLLPVPPYLPGRPHVPELPHSPDPQHPLSPTVASFPSIAAASRERAAALSTTSSSTTATSPRGISRLRATSSPRTTAFPRTNAKTKSVSWISARLKAFVERINKRCDFTGLDAVSTDLKDLWARVIKEGNKRTSREMDDARKILKKLIGHYSQCDKKDLKNFDAEWERYTKIFGKNYIAGEKEMREEIFKKKMREVEKHNELYRIGKVTYSTALNHFSDWTKEELQKKNGFRSLNRTLLSNPKRKARFLGGTIWRPYFYNHEDEVPSSFDWRMKGHISPVKYQGLCGSCYAFAGVGALEAYNINKTGKLIELSAQNILDCTWHLGNNGCVGGDHSKVFEYAESMGVVADYYYPYTRNASHNCRWSSEHVAATDRGYYYVEKGNELALRNAVAIHGPVAVGVATEGLDEYNSGVFITDNCGPIDHTMLVVGYGTDPEYGDYWILKNSYGFWFGEDGYARIARNKVNMCDIATLAYFPY